MAALTAIRASDEEWRAVLTGLEVLTTLADASGAGPSVAALVQLAVRARGTIETALLDQGQRTPIVRDHVRGIDPAPVLVSVTAPTLITRRGGA